VTRRDQVDRVGALLGALALARDPAAEPRNELRTLPELQRWQSERLARSFARLRDEPRFRAATDFFLDDLYGATDASWRDRDLKRMLPTLRTWLPEHMLVAVGHALELDLLSHELDLGVAAKLMPLLKPGEKLDAERYAQAYRAAGTHDERQRQIELLLEVGYELDRIVKRPLIFAILKLARAPARAAKLDRLQSFLERGFGAFAKMGDAHDFLSHIERGERSVMERLFDDDPDPFGA
jgi:hypothetical protein